MKKRICFILTFLLLCSSAFGADRVYVTTNDGHLMAIDGMTAGTWNRASAGDLTLRDIFQPGVNHTALGVGNAGAPSGFQVVAGATDAVIRTWNSDLSLNTYNNALSAPGNAITGIALGNVGTLNNAVIATHGWIDGFGNRGSNMLTFDNTLVFKANSVLPNILLNGIALADLVVPMAGNEILLGGVNDLTLSKASGMLFGFGWTGAATGWIYQHPPNDYVNGVAVGDLLPGLGGDEYIGFGLNGTGADPTFLADGTICYSYPGAPATLHKKPLTSPPQLSP